MKNLKEKKEKMEMFDRKIFLHELAKLIFNAANFQGASNADILTCLASVTLGFFHHFEDDVQHNLKKYIEELLRAQKEVLNTRYFDDIKKKDKNDNRGEI
jgi:hypothetical protein